MAHVTPAYTSRAYRGRNDDGSQTTATWKAAENTTWTQLVGETFRIRFSVQETAGASGSNERFDLQYNLNGAGWTSVTTSSAVCRAVTSPNVANDTPTTRQLSTGSGTFGAGEVTSDGLGTVPTFPSSGYTEVEFIVTLIEADVADGASLALRVIESAGDPVTQTASPTITVSDVVTAPGAPTGLSATAGNSQATLSWTAGSGGTATDYEHRQSTDGGSSWSVWTSFGSSATSGTVTGLTNDQAYVFQVRALNEAGTSSESNTSNSVTPSVPQTAAEFFTDDFAGPTFDTAKWPNGWGAVTIEDGRLKFTPESYTTSDYNGAVSAYAWDLANSHILINPTLPSREPTRETQLNYVIDANNGVYMIVSGAGFIMRKRTAGVNDDTFPGSYDPAIHVWWRIREAAGTLYWDYSSNGVDWENLRTDTHTLNLTAGAVELVSGHYTSDPGTYVTYFDNLNLPPVSSQDESGEGSASIAVDASGAGSAVEQASAGSSTSVAATVSGAGGATPQIITPPSVSTTEAPVVGEAFVATSPVWDDADSIEGEWVLVGAGQQSESGGSAAAVSITTAQAGIGLEHASGGSSVAIATSTSGAGTAVELAEAGSSVAVAVTTASAGDAQERAPPAGSSTTVAVATSGAGEASEHASNGSAASVAVTASGSGEGSVATSNGSSTTVTVTAISAGQSNEQEAFSGGSSATVSATTNGAGEGSLATSDSSSVNVAVGATGAGTAVEEASAGSAVAVSVTATGAGTLPPQPVVQPSVPAGPPVEGEAFTADGGEWDYETTVTYQWQVEELTVQHESGGSKAPVIAAASGAGEAHEHAADDSATSVTATAVGAGNGFEAAADGSATATTVTVAGAGTAAEHASGGSAVSVAVDAQGSGTGLLDTAAGSSTPVTVTAIGAGRTNEEEVFAGGASASVGVVAAGDGSGELATSDGASTAVTAQAVGAGSGTIGTADGSAATVTVSATGAGRTEQVETHSGGSSTALSISTSQSGSAAEQAAGGAAASAQVSATGAGTGVLEAADGAGTTVSVAAGGSFTGTVATSGGSSSTVTVTAVGSGRTFDPVASSSRTFVVPAENRTYLVPAEFRVYVVPPQEHHVVIDDDRTYVVAADDRTVTVAP